MYEKTIYPVTQLHFIALNSRLISREFMYKLTGTSTSPTIKLFINEYKIYCIYELLKLNIKRNICSQSCLYS